MCRYCKSLAHSIWVKKRLLKNLEMRLKIARRRHGRKKGGKG